MDIFEIISFINAIENDASLHEEKNFDKRLEAIDFIGFHVIDLFDTLLQKKARPAEITLLKYRAEKAKAALEEIDINLFQKLRANIHSGRYRGEEFSNLVNAYTGFNPGYTEHQEEPGYDNLDVFINEITHFQPIPEQTKDLAAEMVYYQKTPARIIFELAEKARFSKDDVFFDLGSGLGQAAMLVNLLTGVKVIGVEFEPAFCGYAKDCAAALNLSEVTFINIDARQADYSDGTVFFMYTPFRGEMLQQVLAALRKQSLLRKIRVITYGPCTAEIALQPWLYTEVPTADNIYKLHVFTSL